MQSNVEHVNEGVAKDSTTGVTEEPPDADLRDGATDELEGQKGIEPLEDSRHRDVKDEPTTEIEVSES